MWQIPIHAARGLLLARLTGAIIKPVNRSFGVAMSTKFSEDVIPLTDLKTNPGRVVKHVSDAHRPVLITSRGRGVAVVQSVADFEQTEVLLRKPGSGWD